MKETIRCHCGVSTWFDTDAQSVTIVDAWRNLQTKCRCDEEW